MGPARPLIRRRRTTTASLDEIRYALRDHLDPVALVDETDTVTERFSYDPFGEVRILDADFTPRTTSEFAWTCLKFVMEISIPQTFV